MLLSNVDIQSLLIDQNRIRNVDTKRLQPASYDMVIGTVYRNGEMINRSHLKARSPIEIAPGEVVTMLTDEELILPNNIAATAYAMNSQSSEGLLVLNPGHVDPGYDGPLTVVALNLRKVPLSLLLGEPIFTVVFQHVSSPCNPAYPHDPRKDRTFFENQTNKKVVEKSIGSLRELLTVTEKDIKALISKHWTTWAAGAIAIVTLVSAIAAVLFSMAAVWPKGTSEQVGQSANPATVSASSLNLATPIVIHLAIPSESVQTTTPSNIAPLSSGQAKKLENIVGDRNQ